MKRRRSAAKIDWEKWDHLLGTMFDSQLAEMMGVSVPAVGRRRRELNIPPFLETSPSLYRRKIPKKFDVYLGKKYDSEIARMAGGADTLCVEVEKIIKNKMYKAQSVLEGHEHLLGTMSDQALADKLGTTRMVISNARRKAGIPPFLKISSGPQLLRDDPEEFWKKWDHLLGKMTDIEIAKQAGVASVTVGRRRKSKGIPPYRKHSKK